jgi:hypothetical protein
MEIHSQFGIRKARNEQQRQSAGGGACLVTQSVTDVKRSSLSQ